MSGRGGSCPVDNQQAARSPDSVTNCINGGRSFWRGSPREFCWGPRPASPQCLWFGVQWTLTSECLQRTHPPLAGPAPGAAGAAGAALGSALQLPSRKFAFGALCKHFHFALGRAQEAALLVLTSSAGAETRGQPSGGRGSSHLPHP